MLSPDDTAKYESTLRRSSGISRYSYEVTPPKRRFKTTVPGNRSKRNYLKDERKEQIERENRALIKTMRQYDKYPMALYKGVNHLRYSHSLVLEARKKEIQKVEEENRKIYQRIIKTAATMNTRIFVKEYYKNHQFQYNGGHFKMPPLTNRPKTAIIAFQTNGINSEIPMPRPKTASQPLDPIRRRVEVQKLKEDNQLVLNKSYDVVLFHGMQIVSNKTIMITLWELYKVTDKGREGTNGIKIESKTNNRESGIILSINELIYICSFHPILRKLMKELLLLEEPDIYSSLYKVLGLPNDTTYAVELISFLCKFIKVEDDDRNILEFSDRLKEMIERCHNNEDPDENQNDDDDDMFIDDYENDDDYKRDRTSLSLISGNSTPPPLKSIKDDDDDDDDDILAKQIRMEKNTKVLASSRSSSVSRYSDVKSRITTRRKDMFESDNSVNNNDESRRRRIVTVNYKNTPNYTKELTQKKFTNSPTTTTVKPIKKKAVGPPRCATVTKPVNSSNNNNINKNESPKHKKVKKNVGPPRCASVPLKKDVIIQQQQKEQEEKEKEKMKKVNKNKKNKKHKKDKRVDKEVESADILVLNRDENSEIENENDVEKNEENEVENNNENENNEGEVTINNSVDILQSISRDLDEDEEYSSLVNEMEMMIVDEIEQTVKMNQDSYDYEEGEEVEEEDGDNEEDSNCTENN